MYNRRRNISSLFEAYEKASEEQKHKVFVSYYHNDDEKWRNKFDSLFEDIIVPKSVKPDDIDSDNSDEYVKQLIRDNYIIDSSVIVVLIGEKTWGRKHIDWEMELNENF
jgi:hypothetical protein